MILHRNVSEKELETLLKHEAILGRYNIDAERQSTATASSYVCSAFVDDVWWNDKTDHCIALVLDIPDNRLCFGIGDYWASTEFGKTHVWTGRRGSTHYFIREAYFAAYTINDVVAVGIHKSKHARFIEALKYNKKNIVDKIELYSKSSYNSKNVDLTKKFNEAQQPPLIDTHASNSEILCEIKNYIKGTYASQRKESVYVNIGKYRYLVNIEGTRINGEYTRQVIVKVIDRANSFVKLPSEVRRFNLDQNIVNTVDSFIYNKQ